MVEKLLGTVRGIDESVCVTGFDFSKSAGKNRKVGCCKRKNAQF